MSDVIRELTGEYAVAAMVTGASTVTDGPYRSIKCLGAAVVVTTIGAPTMSSVSIGLGDTVLGHFTSVQFVSGSGVLALYRADEGA